MSKIQKFPVFKINRYLKSPWTLPCHDLNGRIMVLWYSCLFSKHESWIGCISDLSLSSGSWWWLGRKSPGQGRKLFHQHKTQLFSLIGLEEGKEEEFLTKTLEKMNIDSGTITQLTDSFKDQDSVKTLISTFSNPDKLPELLAQQTGMNEDSISSFVNQVKDYIPRYKYKFKRKSYVISFHVFSATDPPNSWPPSLLLWVFFSSISSIKFINFDSHSVP